MIRITRQPIDVAKLLSEVGDDATGAVVVFVGRVRNHSQGQRVTGLTYEAFEEMAHAQLRKIENEARAKWPLRGIGICHRLSDVRVGEISVAVAVSSAHRAEAFAACKFVIDAVKTRVPIWKKEFREGGSFWVEGSLPTAATAAENKNPEHGQ